MGKASSSKKVAKAARAGRTSSTGSERRDLGFPLAMGALLVLGSLMVVWASSSRDASADAPSLRDHWHSAYGVWNCVTESWMPQFTSDFDPRGIHSHNDGLIHIHPFSSSVTGENATLDVWFEAMLVDLDDGDTKLTTPDGTVLENGTECGGEEAVLQVARFDADNIGAGASETITADIGDFVFLGDREAITIALAPIGADIPPPPDERVARIAGVSPERGTPVTIVPSDLPPVDDGSDADSDADDGSDADADADADSGDADDDE